jgi:hypothetical protein
MQRRVFAEQKVMGNCEEGCRFETRNHFTASCGMNPGRILAIGSAAHYQTWTLRPDGPRNNLLFAIRVWRIPKQSFEEVPGATSAVWSGNVERGFNLDPSLSGTVPAKVPGHSIVLHAALPRPEHVIYFQMPRFLSCFLYRDV